MYSGYYCLQLQFKTAQLNFVTFNCRGLSGVSKQSRLKIQHIKKKLKPDILFLQECGASEFFFFFFCKNGANL